MSVAAADIKSAEKAGEKKLKPCCACPETKKARDAWYVNYPQRHICKFT